MTQPTSHSMNARVPAKALGISAAALAVPVLSTLLWTGDLGRQQPLLWLLALVPAFLLAYYRGMRGAAVALAGGMALLSASHALAVGLGRPPVDPMLELAVVPLLLGISFAIGWTTELLHRRFSLVEESASGVILVLTPAGVVQYASATVHGVLGRSASELVGKPMREVLEAGSAAEFEARLGSLGDGDSIELTFAGAQGVRVLDIVVQDRRHVPSLGGFVLRGRDATERRNAEIAARRVARMEAISGVAGALAHDFNNALTTIQANTDLLREDLQAHPGARRRLDELHQAAARSARFVDMLLAFARQQVLRPRRIVLEHVLEEARPKMERVLGPESRVVIEATADVPLLYFDPVRLNQILLLFAARAREAMPHGGRFTIYAASAEITAAEAARYPYPVEPGDYAMLRVSDEGLPLTPHEVETIFMPFTSLAANDLTGLEMSSVYGTIKQAGGYVWAESGPGGTSFRVMLPIAADPLPLLVDPNPASLSGRTVLVAEDDPSVRGVVCEVLLRQGYCVIEALDGNDALRMVEQMGTRPDVLVTDLLMPNLDGRALAAEMTRRYGQFPILFISGYTQEALLVESVLNPGETLLSKPFSVVELTETLRDVLEGTATFARGR